MTLSVIVICLNEERHLARCLSALTRLDHGSLEVEIVVVDGGSTDRSRAIARSWGTRVIDSPPGIPVQRNAGARAARGDVLAYVDADVEVCDGWFAAIERYFRDTRVRIVGCPPRLPSDASWIARAYALHAGFSADQSVLAREESARVLSTASLVMGREVFHQVGRFREDLGVDEDTVFLLEAKRRGVPLFCEPGLAYVHHGEPRTLGEFFRRIVWGTNSIAWYRSLLSGDFAAVGRRQYLYGTVIAVQLVLFAVTAHVASWWNWRNGIAWSVALLTLSFLFPAVHTAVRRRSARHIGALWLMYAVLGVASASAMAGLGRNKSRRWR